MRTLKMRLRLSALRVAAVAAALAFALGGCGSASRPASHALASDGPLSSGNGIHDPSPPASVCAPSGRPWAFGLDRFTNYGHATVVLDRVVLLRPRNEHLVGSYAVPGDR